MTIDQVQNSSALSNAAAERKPKPEESKSEVSAAASKEASDSETVRETARNESGVKSLAEA